MKNEVETLIAAKALSPWLDFIAGTISGVAGLIVGHPFDTVKVRFQTPGLSEHYSGTWNAFTSIVKEEGFFGLFKGITSPLAMAGFLNGLMFASYGFFRKIQLEEGQTVASSTLGQIAWSGAACGVISTFITSPTELVKIRQQASLIPTSTRSVWLQLYEESGVQSVFHGFSATALRDVVGWAVYFWAYEALRRAFSSTPGPELTLSWPAAIFAGGFAGCMSWALSFPMDVVKTRVQGSSSAKPHHRTSAPEGSPLLAGNSGDNDVPKNPYRTMWGAIVNSYRDEGLGVFFLGLSPTLLRAFPVNVVIFGTFELMVRVLSG